MRAADKYSGKTSEEIIDAIISEYNLSASITLSIRAADHIKKALNEAFSVGWGRGEDFAKEYYAKR